MHGGPPPKWTREQDASLRQLWDDRTMSCAKVAQRINREFGTTYTRNSIIGRASRIGLASHAPPPRIGPIAKRKPRTRWTPKVVPWSPAPRETHQEPPLQAPEPSWEPSNPVTMAELGEHTCRYPLWDDYGPLPDVPLFCGAEPVAGETYCPWHKREAYQPRRNDDRERERHMRWKV